MLARADWHIEALRLKERFCRRCIPENTQKTSHSKGHGILNARYVHSSLISLYIPRVR